MRSERAAGRVRSFWQRWGAGLALAAAAGAILVPVAWVTTDALERNNDFCTACHLSEGVWLHSDLRRQFDARPASSLAAAHGTQDLRCIDCHGGTGLYGRARVKVLAAKDALVWLTGPVEEPTEMHWPLLDADCRKCHAQFAEKAHEFADPFFHELAVHNVELGVACVDCHLSHPKGGKLGAQFLDAGRVRRQCALCHVRFRDGANAGENQAASYGQMAMDPALGRRR